MLMADAEIQEKIKNLAENLKKNHLAVNMEEAMKLAERMLSGQKTDEKMQEDFSDEKTISELMQDDAEAVYGKEEVDLEEPEPEAAGDVEEGLKTEEPEHEKKEFQLKLGEKEISKPGENDEAMQFESEEKPEVKEREPAEEEPEASTEIREPMQEDEEAPEEEQPIPLDDIEPVPKIKPAEQESPPEEEDHKSKSADENQDSEDTETSSEESFEKSNSRP